MMGTATDFSNLRVNLGLVLTGDVDAVRAYLQELARYVEAHHELRLVFRETSVDRLWIKRAPPPQQEDLEEEP